MGADNRYFGREWRDTHEKDAFCAGAGGHAHGFGVRAGSRNIFGNNDWYGAEQAAKLSGDEPILLDADGTIMPQT